MSWWPFLNVDSLALARRCTLPLAAQEGASPITLVPSLLPGCFPFSQVLSLAVQPLQLHLSGQRLQSRKSLS
ncbi:hypothetical protein ACFLUC_01490 [Chloroflexota bacterium]